MNDCFICEKHKKKNDAARFHVLSTPLISIYHMFPKNGRVYLGHVFIETNRHIPGLADMTIDEAYQLGKYQKIISHVFMDFFGAEHVYSFVFGDVVPHLHLHLIPRYIGAPEAYRGTKVDEWPEAPHGNDTETIQFCRELNEKIKILESKVAGKISDNLMNNLS